MTKADMAEETTERAGARDADDATVESEAKATVADAKESATGAKESVADAEESAADAKEPAADTGARDGAKAQPGARTESGPNDGTGAGDTAAGSRWWTPLRLTAGVAVIALIAAAVFGVLWATDDSADQLAALQGRLDTEAAAEAAATRYAMSVSEVDFRDLGKWRAALTEGASAQLAPKLEAAVDVVGPWLTTMEYTASARPLAARVSENDGDRFVVQVFVDMTSKSKQASDGVAATATYTVTMDRASNWTITDVGGVGAGLPGAETPAPAPGAPAPAPAPGAPAPAPGAEGK